MAMSASGSSLDTSHNGTRSPKTISQEILLFYFKQHNVLLVDPSQNKDGTFSVENFFMIQILRQYYDTDIVKDHLLANPIILKLLVNGIKKDQIFIDKIVSSFLSYPCSNDLENESDLNSYLTHIEKTDNLLFSRIIELLSTTTECSICMDNETSIIFNCGHGTCVNCHNHINNCHLCRTPITTKNIKENLIKQQNLKESEKMNQDDSKSKKIVLQLKKSEEFITKRLDMIFQSKGRLRPDHKEEIKILCDPTLKYYKKFFILIPTCCSEEMLAYTCSCLFPPMVQHQPWDSQETETSNFIINNLTNPNRLHRFLAALAGNEPDTKENISLKIPQRLRRFIFSTFNKMNPHTMIQMIKSNSGFWKKLFTYIHAGELVYKGTSNKDKKRYNLILALHITRQKILVDPKEKGINRLKSVNLLSDDAQRYAISNGLTVSNGILLFNSPIGELNKIFNQVGNQKNNENIEPTIDCKNLLKRIIKIFCENRGILFRNFRRFLTTFQCVISQKDIDYIVVNGLIKLDVNQLVDLCHVLENHQEIQYMFSECNDDVASSISNMIDPVVMTRKGTIKSNYGKKYIIENKLLEECIKNIKLVIIDNLKKIDHIDTLVIDNTCDNQLVNKSEYTNIPKWCSTTPLTRGDIIELDPTKDIIIYIYWQDTVSGKTVDLDMSFHSGDDKCDYTNLVGFNNTVQHSGDITSAPTGASEYITFNIDKFKEKNASRLGGVISCLSYNNIPFDDMQQAIVGIGINNGNGKGPLNSETLSVACLRGSSKINIAGYLDFKKNTFQFMNVNVKSGNGNHSVGSDQRIIDDTIDNFLRWRQCSSQPSHKQIAYHLCSIYDNVIIFTGEKKHKYTRHPMEKSSDFMSRIIQQVDGVDIIDWKKDFISLCENGCIYFGSKDIELPSNSIIVNKLKPSNNDSTWVSDAYSILTPNNFNTKKSIDDYLATIGILGTIKRDNIIFKIKKVPENGNCLFESVIQQINTDDKKCATYWRKEVTNKLQKQVEQNPDFRKEFTSKIICDWKEYFLDFLGNFDDTQLLYYYFEIMNVDPTTDDYKSDKIIINNKEVPNSIFWGGHFELIKLAELLNIKIGLINSNSTDITYINDNNSDVTNTIYIYYSGNHYNIARKKYLVCI